MNTEIKSFINNNYKKIIINNDRPLITFDEDNLEESDVNNNLDINYNKDEGVLIIKIPLKQYDRVLGLGEKAYSILRNRNKFTMYNTDSQPYARYKDPLYISVPFLIIVSDNINGILINSTSKIDVDIGIEEYDKIIIKIYNKLATVYLFNESSFDGLYKKYSGLTGKTFMPPLWSLGHSISRYTYYPEKELYSIIDEYKKITEISAVYLDIDYMDRFKIFTVDKNRFNLSSLTKNLHDENIKLITIIDPGIKIEQNYDVFAGGLGNYVENSNGEIYASKLWPGNCAMPDFFDKKAYNWWKSEIKNFAKNTDGIWLDMNEPSLFNDFKTIDDDALHRIDGEKTKHKYLHNAYSYFEVRSTYEALSEEKKEVFILSRSGYTGIQKYAAVWTGDNTSSEDDLTLQISAVISLNLSGIPVCGCDLGGFAGYSSPELIMKYYRMALLFPLYRNHKGKEFNDQEIYKLPDIYREKIIKAIDRRYELLNYLYSAIYNSHTNGEPVIKPLFYYDYRDINGYYINDEYIMGNLLYAPQIYNNKRTLYLPSGKWLDISNFNEIDGKSYIETEEEFPMYLKNNSMLLINSNIIVYGDSKFIIYSNSREITLSFKNGTFESSSPVDYELIFYNIKYENAKMDGKNIKINKNGNMARIKMENNKIVEFY